MAESKGVLQKGENFEGAKKKLWRGKVGWIIFKIEENGGERRVEVNATGEKDSGWEEMLSKLPKTDGRFCIVDHCLNPSKSPKKTQILFTWLPTNSPPTTKATYSSYNKNMLEMTNMSNIPNISDSDALRKLLKLKVEVEESDSEVSD